MAPASAETVKGEEFPGNRLDVGFDQDSKVLSAGIMHGGGIVGVDFEYGLTYLLGLQAGVGAAGINAGLNFHVASDMKKDLYFSGLAVYLPSFDHLVMPSIAFGMRWYLGPAYRVGLDFALGTMIVLKDADMEVGDRRLLLEKDRILPRLSLGLAFKL